MEETKNEVKSELISISKEQLDAVVDEAVKKAMINRGVPEKMKRVMERIVKVRFYKDKLVRKFANVEEEQDEKGKTIWYMDITLDGQEEVEKVEYLKFLDRTPQYRAFVKKTEYKELVEVDDPNHEGGKFVTENPDEAKIERKNFTARVENAEVTKRVKESEIEIMEGPFSGQKFTIVDNDTANF